MSNITEICSVEAVLISDHAKVKEFGRSQITIAYLFGRFNQLVDRYATIDHLGQTQMLLSASTGLTQEAARMAFIYENHRVVLVC